MPTSSFPQQKYLKQNFKKTKTERVFALPEKSTNTHVQSYVRQHIDLKMIKIQLPLFFKYVTLCIQLYYLICFHY